MKIKHVDPIDSTDAQSNENIDESDINDYMVHNLLDATFYFLYGSLSTYYSFKGYKQPTVEETVQKLTHAKFLTPEQIKKSPDPFIQFLNWFTYERTTGKKNT